MEESRRGKRVSGGVLKKQNIMTDKSKKGRTQCEMLAEHLKNGGTLTFMTAFFDFGVGNAKGRIHDLRKKYGLPIVTNWQAFTSKVTGHRGRYAVYSLPNTSQ